QVVDKLFQAASNLDPSAAVTLTYKPEARALYDYAGLFLPEAHRRVQAINADESFSLDVTKVEVDTTGDNGTRLVRVPRLEARGPDGDDQRRYHYDRGCLVTERLKPGTNDVDTTTRACDGTIGPPISTDRDGDAPKLDKLTAWQRLGRAFPTF